MTRLRRAVSLAMIIGSTAPAFAQEAILRSITVYGTDRFTAADVREEFPDAIGSLVAAAQSQDQTRGEESIERMRATLAARGDFALLDVSVTFTSAFPDMLLDLSIDVVEPGDRARRMPFRPAPTDEIAAPSAPFDTWKTYEQTGFELLLAGELQNDDPTRCPALHCIWSFEDPRLAVFLPALDRLAHEHEGLLYVVLERERDRERRALAPYLLAHTNDRDRLLPALGRAIFDADGGVRNNAMRVMLYIAMRDPVPGFPLDALIAAMDFPNSSDRNKSASTISMLAQDETYRELIRAKGVPALLRLLRNDKPNEHGPAYQALLRISGESLPDDYAAWERWAAGAGQ